VLAHIFMLKFITFDFCCFRASAYRPTTFGRLYAVFSIILGMNVLKVELCADELVVGGGVVWSYDRRRQRAAHFSSAAAAWLYDRRRRRRQTVMSYLFIA